MTSKPICRRTASSPLAPLNLYQKCEEGSIHELGGLLTSEEWQPETQKDRGVTEMFDPAVSGLENHVAGT
jgi:hypothetical protein